MAKRHPLLYQVNTRVLLGELARRQGCSATLGNVPDALLDEVAERGFDWFWPLGIWRTGPSAREVSRARADWRSEFLRDLPDLREEDISGSPFAIQAYEVNSEFGGEAALEGLRGRLAKRGVSLMLDFVPNHVSPDHPWVTTHVEWLVEGTQEDLVQEPWNWIRVGPNIVAHGRDPNFPGWPDTVQLNYRHPGLRAAVIGELRRVAARCDGVRCDMAMLELPEVFARTWGDRGLPRDGAAPVDAPFWPEAAAAVRKDQPGFLLMAEAYWDLEWELQHQGFDFTYDKRLYDRLRSGDVGPVRDHQRADAAFQNRSVRFLENHDEPRAAAAFPSDRYRAVAVVTFLAPGLRLFHEGQLEGRKVHVSMHLGRRPDEPVDEALRDFYGRLLAVLRRPEVHEGLWRLRECHPAWNGNPTSDGFIAMSWEGPAGRLLACVNLGPTQGQTWAEAGFSGLGPGRVVLQDLLGDACYERDGAELAERGLYLDIPAGGHHVFAVHPA
jgi:hypothetical protein